MRAESREAFRALLDVLAEIDAEFVGATAPGAEGDGEARNAHDEIALDHRLVMHLLGGGLDLFFEADPAAPELRQTLQAGRRFYGDNPDAVYHSTPIRPDLAYRISGNTDGTAYLSFTVEGGGGIDERYPPGRVVSSLNDTALEIGPAGDFTLIASRERPAEGAWLPLAEDACSIVTRHYYEGERPVDRRRRVPLAIEVLRAPGNPPPPPARPDATSVARGIRRVANFVRGLSLDYARNGPALGLGGMPPNVFSDPTPWPGEPDRPSVDQSNATARFVLGDDEALVIEGRFPPCRFANVVLWNRHLQTLEFERRRSSLNRRQTVQGPDGRFRMVVAHADPGHPNWLDTGGTREGLIFVRFLLPEAQPEPLTSRVVSRAALAAEAARVGAPAPPR